MALRSLLRQTLPPLALAGALAGAVTLARGARIPPADFVINNGTEVATLDPAQVTGQPEGRALKMLLEGLTVSHPKTLQPLPGMAERWDLSEDGRTYTFHIRKDAVWTDGRPVTAHDFVYTYERFLNPETAGDYASMLWYVEGAEAYTNAVTEDGKAALPFDTVGIHAPDEHTLVMRLHSPTPYFLDITSFYPLVPVSQAGIEATKERFPDTWEQEWLKPENLVTNGPWRLEFRHINDRMRFVKNPDYWDADSVAFEVVDMLALEHYTTSFNMYATGECHWIDVVPSNLVPRLVPREDMNPEPYLASYFYRVNVTRPPFDDARVRRALALAVPRRAIVERITKAGQVPAWSIVPPGIEGYTPAEMERPGSEEERLAEARALLAEAGYGPGGRELPTVEILYNVSDAHRDIAEVISEAWANALGLRTKLLNQEWKVYLDTQKSLNYDVCRSSWIGDYADPNTFLDLFLTGAANNRTGWSSDAYDELIARANRTLDAAARFELMAEAEALLMRELPIIPIYYYVVQSTYSPRLGGCYANAKDDHPPKFWYWMNDEELAERRAGYPDEGYELVEAAGPAKGLYPPKDPRSRTDALAGKRRFPRRGDGDPAGGEKR